MFDFNIWVGIFNILAGVSTFVTALILILDYLSARRIPIHIQNIYPHDSSDETNRYKIIFGQLKSNTYTVIRLDLKSNSGRSCFAEYTSDDYGSAYCVPILDKKSDRLLISVPPESIKLDEISHHFEVFGVESSTTLSVVVKNRLSIKESKRTINLYNI